MTDYYDRQGSEGPDGLPVFAADRDKSNESEVAQMIGAAWGCEVRPYGMLSPVDWYAIRDGHVVANLELKSRTHDSQKYPTVMLNIRKWLALGLIQIGMGCPSIYVARLTDGVWWIRYDDIPTHDMRIGGASRIVKSKTDIEPIFYIPIASMRKLNEPDN